ncbi:hypothetical protein [Anatilimnocola floriformis]|uniref:hypothetical protein n=1 Tax=Anatilimnocola floriformis TaxID=2948575 RepID=UPI0020C4487D|nr:hypothetical protein [Anatilimnocola floriformis]
MQIRIETSIASADWSFAPGQLIDVGTHIPAEMAAAWLDSGIATRTTETASLKRKKHDTLRPGTGDAPGQ